MSYPVVRTDNLAGTKDPAKLRSIRFYNGSNAATAINNGCVAKLSALETGEREIWKAVATAVNTPMSEVVLVATPELMYDERLKNLDDFTNAAGEVARGYRLESGDVFSVTTDGLTVVPSAAAAGHIVELAADTKLKVVASLTSGSTKVGKVIAVETVGTKTYVVIEVA